MIEQSLLELYCNEGDSEECFAASMSVRRQPGQILE
jgi:hypothetical protein